MSTKKVLHKVKNIAGVAARVPWVKTIFKPFYYPFKNALMRKYKKNFQKSALEALVLFDKCLSENQIPYTLAFGSLLGAIREKGFLKHDIDIDVFVWEEDYSDKIKDVLTKKGFALSHTFTVDGGVSGREETYRYKGAFIDIFYLFPLTGDTYYCCDFLYYPGTTTVELSMKKFGAVLPRRIELPIKKEIIRTQFENLSLPVPVNSDGVLRYRYGDDYMIPNTNWGINSYNNHITEWGEKKAIYTNYD